MTTLADLERTVASIIASKRIGKAVFVRYLLRGVLEGPVLEALAKVAGVVGDWLGQPPERVYALFADQPAKQQGTLALSFPDGATALVSEIHGLPGRGIELMVVGSRGAIYHHEGDDGVASWEQAAAALKDRRDSEILAAIEDGLAGRANPAAVAKPAARLKPVEPAAKKSAPEYGILLVTGGHTHQENYAEAFAADPRCQLIAVTDEPDVDGKRRKLNDQLAAALGVPYIPDLGKALERKDVHVASICAPPQRRGRIAVRCALAGKHLYLDKSLAPRLDEADALVAAVRKAGVKSHMFTMVTQAWARAAKRLVDSGRLGKLVGIHADTFFAKGKTGTARPSPRQEEYPPQRHQLVDAKRELDNVGVYPIALIRWLTGKKFRTVYGKTANYFFQEHQQHDVEDFGLLACTLEDGLPVTISAGRFGWTSHPAGGVNRIVLVGSERTVVVDANRPRLEVANDEPPWVPPALNPLDPMGFWKSTLEQVHARPKTSWQPLWPAGTSDAGYFIDCLEAGRDSELSVAEAALTTEVLLAAYRSARGGAVVTLPLPR